jgi:hypothetical protein
MADPKRKTENALRTPGPKKKLGLVVPPPLRMPHDELIPDRPLARISDIPETTLTSQTSLTSQGSPLNSFPNQPLLNKRLELEDREIREPDQLPEVQDPKETMTSLTSQTSHSSPTKQKLPDKAPIAPNRDFTRVANSISREAVPAGVFKGKSKLLYDCLYTMTRGAVVPSRTVRISRPKLMKAAGIGSRVTFDTNINHLCAVGLIEVKSITGEHNGNEYTVYIPEESEATMTSQTSQTSLTGYAHKLDRLVRLETSQTSHTSNPAESTSSVGSHTFFNTNTDDDDGVNAFAGIIREAAVAILGHEIPKSDVERDRWKDLAGLLAEELGQAAERAGQISSVPAFFAAHLRRRLKAGTAMKKDLRADPQLARQQAAALSKEQQLLKMIKELNLLHVGDPDYQQSDLIDDLKFRCKRASLEWDEAMIARLLKPVDVAAGEEN